MSALIVRRFAGIVDVIISIVINAVDQQWLLQIDLKVFIMLICQQRDPSRMPAAYPIPRSASTAAPRKQAEANPVPPQTTKVGG